MLHQFRLFWFAIDAKSDGIAISATLARLDKTLDLCADALSAGDGRYALGTANDALATIRTTVDDSMWDRIVRPHVRRHRFAQLTLQCPLTRRSFERPRGYAGDAELLDLIYGHKDVARLTSGLSGVARTAQEFTFAVPACAAVRARRLRLAEAIDAAALNRPGTRVLSVACGHLRELEDSKAFEGGQVEMMGLDQDSLSLQVAASYRTVQTVRASVRDLLAAATALTDFDLIYAAGLYDYLDRRTAVALTKSLFSRLGPGGRLIVANFLTGVWEAPYLDVFMDWQLIYRDESEIEAFAGSVDPATITDMTVTRDPQGYIGYLELTHR